MTRLYSFLEEKFGKLARSRVKRVEAGILYYLYSGRNAWHSTWVTLYTEGCMHSELESAKHAAERLRTQGSVFYIAELPALVYRSAKGTLAVTQINSDSPLADYSAEAIQQEVASNTRKLRDARDCYLSEGAPMLGVALSFDHGSRFWTRRPPWRNSVIVVASDDPKLPFAPLTASKLQSRRSRGNGSHYLLGWNNVADRYGSTATKPVRDLAARFDDNTVSHIQLKKWTSK